MLDFRGHTSGFRWNDWYIYSKCMFISVYSSAVLPVSVQHCLCHSKETAHWAVWCLDSLRCSIFYTVGHHQLRRKQHTVQGCITVQRLIFEEIVKMGFAWVCCCWPARLSHVHHARLWVGGWASRLGPVIRRAIYMSSLVQRGVVIWAFHVTSRLVQT